MIRHSFGYILIEAYFLPAFFKTTYDHLFDYFYFMDIDKVKQFFIDLSETNFVLIPIFLNITFVIVYAPLLSLINEQSDQSDQLFHPIYDFLKLVIFSPILETLLLQLIPIELLLRLKINRIVIILFSGILFGILHFTNRHLYSDTVVTTIAGIFLAFLYLIAKERENKRLNPLLSLTLIHAGYNLFVYSVKLYFFQYD